MNFTGTIIDKELVFAGQQAELRKRYVSSMKDGAVIRESLTKETLPKTHQQCKAHFGLALAMIVESFNDNGWDASMLLKLDTPTGVGINKDLLQCFFYALFPVYDDDHKQITLSKMSTMQASAFFEQIRNFASSQWSIVIPEPDKNWANKQHEAGGQ
jgi:hypothetical protein